MKRKLWRTIPALALVALMLMGLCACGSNWGTIKSAYEEAGYHEYELTDEIEIWFNFNKTEAPSFGEYTTHFMTVVEDPERFTYDDIADRRNVVIWEYKSVAAMEKAYKDFLYRAFGGYTGVDDSLRKDVDAAWEDFRQRDYVNGNCILYAADEPDIFMNAK